MEKKEAERRNAVRLFFIPDLQDVYKRQVREWSYAAPGQADFYGCTVPDGEAVGRGLGEQLWSLAAKYDLNS